LETCYPEDRDERIAHIRANAPRDWQFAGFGGSSAEFETLVFNDSTGAEWRIPVDPDAWNMAGREIQLEYGCEAEDCACEYDPGNYAA